MLWSARLPTGLAALLLLVARPAFASWNSASGVLVTSAAALRLPQLAIADGQGGAFVVLTGATGPGVVGVFVQHLTADGEIAAGWTDAGVAVGPAASVTSGTCLPSRLVQSSAASDGSGGVYVAWAGPPLEPASNAPSVYVQHIDANGQRAAGWPAPGLAVTTGAGQSSSLAYPDGGGGVFVVWRDVRHLFPFNPTGDDPHIMLQHFLADGSRAPHFTTLGRFLGSGLPPVNEPRLDASFVAEPTGGAWAMVQRASADTTVDPAGFIVMRFDLDGFVASGWGEDGIMLPGPSADVGHPGTRSAHLFADGAGGAWAFVSSGARGAVVAFHLFADGSPDPALPVGGLGLDAVPGESVEPDGVGGFFVREATDSGVLSLRHLKPDGNEDAAWAPPVRICGGLDATLFPTADGVLGVGWVGLSSQACVTTSAEALVGRLARDGSVPADWHTDGIGTLGVAAAVNASGSSHELSTVSCADGTGGYIVAWRVIDAVAPVLPGEVRAKRYALQGAVAGVDGSGPGPLLLHGARFTAAGLRVRLGGVAAGGARLDVYDLLGRRLASADVPALATEVAIPGTRDVPSGLYFLRLRCGSAEVRARAVVVR